MITFGFKDKFSGWVRAVAAIVLGVILVARPEEVPYLVVELAFALLQFEVEGEEGFGLHFCKLGIFGD
ncbi:MAG: hypothetical protein ACI3ZN_04415, partial [Candidatus Cryptobacteroides sp.]